MRLILILLLAACSNTKSADSNSTKQAGSDEKLITANTPACIKSMIKDFQSQAVTNPPKKIYSYTYQNKTVYYVTAECCDQYSNLYSDDCKLLGHPDGGFTGKGDRKFPDWFTARTNEKLVWEDTRK